MNTTTKSLLGCLVLLSLSGTALAGAPAEPTPCSITVAITTRTGAFRATANALEVWNLAEKGLTVCQGDSGLKCNTEFQLFLRYRADKMTRNVAIYRRGKLVLSADFTGRETSQKIMKSVPACSVLHKLSGGEAPRLTQ